MTIKMTWTYSQSTGEVAENGATTGTGYSGIGAGLNNPLLQDTPDVGPIPQGNYTISASFNDPDKGPDVMNLAPDPTNQMFGRSGFMIHGDNSAMNHTASWGCIILDRELREGIATSGDNVLTVTG
jgi:Protein of unknown function (DUF2778)